jgi:hypothetical protein
VRFGSTLSKPSLFWRAAVTRTIRSKRLARQLFA